MDEPEATPARVHDGPPNKLVRNVVITLIVCFFVAAYTGDLFVGNLAKPHPLIFIALNSRNRDLVLASPHLGWTAFYSVAFVRLLISDPLFFILGRWYGDAGVRWMERKTPTYGKMMRSAEGWFSKAAYPLVALAPNNFICLFAGASGMGVPGFFIVNVVGTMIRLYLLRVFANIFEAPLNGVTTWMGHHKLLVFGLSGLLILFSLWSERRAAGESELEQFVHLDESIAKARADLEAEAETEGPQPADDALG